MLKPLFANKIFWNYKSRGAFNEVSNGARKN